MSSRRRSQVKVTGLLASAVALAALVSGGLSHGAAAREALVEPVSCSVFDVPSLETPVVPRSDLVDGGIYVLVCEDGTRHEVVNTVFVHRLSGR
jgi:hypothetical protein